MYLIFTFLVLWLQAVFAVQPEQLGIKYNYSMLQANGNLVYGGSVQTKTPFKDRSDGNIVHLAVAAHKGVIAAHNAYQKERTTKYKGLPYTARKPDVTTVLIVDNTAYIATSITGGSIFYQGKQIFSDLAPVPDNTLRAFIVKGLNACAAAVTTFPDSDLGHRTGASCGEFMALLAYEQQNGELQPSDVVIVSVTGSTQGGGQIKVRAPCTGGSTGKSSFGCTQFLDWDGWNGQIRAITDETLQEEVFDLADNEISLAPLSFA